MKIAVVGAGVGGLVAARALVLAGIDAQVLEAGPRPGGVVATTSVDGYVREHAASSFPGGPPRGALALCKALGVEVDRASPRARRRWIYLDGKLRAVPRSPIDLVTLATSDLLTWRGKLDLLGEPFRPAGSGDDESVHAFAARRFGAEAARAIFAPLVTGIHAADAHAISVLAGVPWLAALDTQGGMVRGLLAQAVRGLAGKLRGKQSGATPRGMWAPRGGLGTLVAALAGELGARIHLSHPVARIEPADRGVRIDGERWDGAVLAVPAEDAAALVTLPDLANRLAMFHRAPAALVFLGYPARAVPGASDSFGFLVAQGENVRVLGVGFESTVWPGRAPEGHVLLRCVFGGGRDPEATRQGDADLIAQARHDLGIALGVDAEPGHTSVVRERRGVAQYGLGHRERVRDAVALARGQRLALAGADYRGPGINDLCTDAASIVTEVCAW